MTLSWNRVLSVILAAIYVVVAFVTSGGEDGFRVLLAVLLPLACIWFGDAMGGFTGPAGTIGITAASPGLIVCILGWVILLLPIVFMVV
jgi:hypothetical protein